MKIIAKGNKHTFTVNRIKFDEDGSIKHILGFFEMEWWKL